MELDRITRQLIQAMISAGSNTEEARAILL